MNDSRVDAHSFRDGVSYHATQSDFLNARNRCAKACDEFNQLGATATDDQRSAAWRRIVSPGGEDHATPYVKSPIDIDYGLRLCIGPDTIIDHDCTILDTPVADIRIGSKCTIGHHVLICGVLYDANPDEKGRRISFGNPVTIGDNVWIGAKAIILPGVKIGSRSKIARGSFVCEDVPSDCVAAGSPAKIIRYVQPDESHESLHVESLEEALAIVFTHDSDSDLKDLDQQHTEMSPAAEALSLQSYQMD